MTTTSSHRLDSKFDAIEEFITDLPTETVARVVTIPIYLRQIHRLQTRTNSWMDKPVPLPFQALMLGLPPLVHQTLAPKIELRQPNMVELSQSLWISELNMPVLVKASKSESSAQFVIRDGKRVLTVSQRFFTRPERVQRAHVAAAERNDTSNLPVTLATQVLAMTAERVIWHLLVGDRDKLSKRRAVAFVGLELARTQAVRTLRPALARKLRKA